MPIRGRGVYFASPISAASGLKEPISKLFRIDWLCSAGAGSKASNVDSQLSSSLCSVTATAHWFGCVISGSPIRRPTHIVSVGRTGGCRNSGPLRKAGSQEVLAWVMSRIHANGTRIRRVVLSRTRLEIGMVLPQLGNGVTSVAAGGFRRSPGGEFPTFTPKLGLCEDSNPGLATNDLCGYVKTAIPNLAVQGNASDVVARRR
jgi:hypothetical protein